MELVVLALGVLGIAGGVVWHAVTVLWERRLMVRHRVLVQLVSGKALTGALWARRGRTVVLKSAELHEPGAAATVMDGDVVVDRGQVEYMQVIR